MTKADKIRARIAAADTNLTFAQVDGYLRKIAIAFRVSGSHHVYTFPNHQSLSIPRGKGGTIKAVYLRSIAAMLDTIEPP